MLVKIAKTLPHTNGLYICYNKSIATESTKKFPKSTHCMTTHSLAYQATIKPYNLKLGEFSYRTITEKLDYDKKLYIVDNIKEFCLSSYTSFTEYAADKHLPANTSIACRKYLDGMASGTTECTHDFYLKFFHIHLASGDIEYEPFDFIMVDEAGDINPVTLEIFRLLPSPRKIAVGDPFQNIYTFNHTINAFTALADEGTLFKMTRSFRVSDYIAPHIEHFVKTYLDPSMQFVGTPVTSTVIKSSAYITRTNGALISRMIELNASNSPYGLVRKASEIFKVPLMLIGLKHKGFITEASYKHLQSDVNDWYESTKLQTMYKNVLSYLAFLYTDDIPLVQSIRLVQRHGSKLVMTAFTESRKHERSDQPLLLMTAHSAKGLEVDEVTIAEDLNYSVVTPMIRVESGMCISELAPQEQEALRLYYVACTRAGIKLNNANNLTGVDRETYPELAI